MNVDRIRGLSVKVNKNNLIIILKDNKNKHKEIYGKAIEEWKSQIKKTSRQISDCNNDATLDALLKEFKDLDKPQNYEGAYAKAINMLEVHTEENLELDHDLFERLHNDNWEWRRAFAASTSKYLG